MLKNPAENPQGVVVPPVEGVAGGGTAYGWNDAGLPGSDPPKGSIDPTEAPTADLVHVWCMPSTANVGPQETPRHLEPVSIIALLFICCLCLQISFDDVHCITPSLSTCIIICPRQHMVCI